MKKTKRIALIVIIAALIVSMFSVVSFGATKPAKVTNLKVTARTYSSISLSWKKVSGASGYKVYRATSKAGTYKKVKTIKGRTKNSYKDKNLKSNKTYYYKVRAYKKANGKQVNGAYSVKVSDKTNKCLFVNKDTVTVSEGGKTSVVVTFKQNDSVYCDSDDDCIADCEWSRKWDGNDTKLYIYGESAGETYITISTDHNKEKKRIKVIVKPLVSVKLPDLPMEITDFSYKGHTLSTIKINSIDYTIGTGLSNDFIINIKIKGKKTYDAYGPNNSSMAEIGYKLYKGNTVVDSGTVYTEYIATNEGFEEEIHIYDIEKGNYTLKLLDVY